STSRSKSTSRSYLVNFEFKLNFDVKVNFEIKVNFKFKLDFELKSTSTSKSTEGIEPKTPGIACCWSVTLAIRRPSDLRRHRADSGYRAQPPPPLHMQGLSPLPRFAPLPIQIERPAAPVARRVNSISSTRLHTLYTDGGNFPSPHWERNLQELGAARTGKGILHLSRTTQQLSGAHIARAYRIVAHQDKSCVAWSLIESTTCMSVNEPLMGPCQAPSGSSMSSQLLSHTFAQTQSPVDGGTSAELPLHVVPLTLSQRGDPLLLHGPRAEGFMMALCSREERTVQDLRRSKTLEPPFLRRANPFRKEEPGRPVERKKGKISPFSIHKDNGILNCARVHSSGGMRSALAPPTPTISSRIAPFHGSFSPLSIAPPSPIGRSVIEFAGVED
ncbi:unnamed protein product, partial [Nesidiocoris tenuis]